MSSAADVHVCELWPHHDRRFHDRHYNAWWGNSAECGAKVVVPNRIHKLLKEQPESVKIVCVQCAERPIVSK